ncbi:glycosyltransferase family 4 protein [Candidatus Peregrinibacteria bacterium]|jgi:glycosyltransferase involved in cell wall biosynthesis|nr:glycosyltransferase family 4 protein [Candidatus Peregrinibacteria bacterium]MBT3598359.1 glycosyltransferase family 4 protein [Candidatus Peregrinibacteria bacterium]MBT4367355.1 glycosyltransferase family 4 protein [Candidatus Peregrinibacteria bacterium]MBT4585541.1 glycosyltransferase family 4 protein [Candidatus Peregrinibacteria bacterium]MBT6731356.1 glycosyltransferase family 4 protein [Candidatus Peregrinibacteria bacterium]
MVNIGIDCRLASSPTGLGRYTREIVSELVLLDSGVKWTLFVNESIDWIPKSEFISNIVTTNIPHYSLSEQIKFPRIIKKQNLDLLFVPHFNVPLNCPVPFVATVHDLILHSYPNQSSLIKRLAYKKLLLSTVRKSKSLIAVSKYTADEIEKAYGSEAFKKTTVVSEAVNPIFKKQSEEDSKSILKKYGIDKPFFMYIGNAKEHKNVNTLIQAFADAKIKDTELVLILSGPEAEKLKSPAEVKKIKNVADSDLPHIYSQARAFVTASLYEGFCLPILEARSCGCPVIASNSTAIKELGAPGVLLVEPNIAAFAEAFKNFVAPDFVEPSNRLWKDVALETQSILLQANQVQ